MSAAVRLVVGSIAFGGSGVIKKLILLLGAMGDNGKSEFVRWLRSFLGEYAFSMSKARRHH